MHLYDALIIAGVTQAELADYLGVTPMSVSRWVREEQDIPDARARSIEEFLKLSTHSLDPWTTSKGEPDFHKARSMFGWLLATTSMSSHLGGLYRNRLARIADMAEVEVSEVIAWATATRLVPLRVAMQVLPLAWPGVNPKVFAYEVGEEIPEVSSVEQTVEDLYRNIHAVPSYAALEDIVRASRRNFERNPYKPPMNPSRFEAILDDSRPVPEALARRVELIRSGQTTVTA